MVSKNISEAEAFKSVKAIKLGIDNTTKDSEILANMSYVANNVFEPLRKHFNRAIGISSFYRSFALNKALKGSKTSQHLTGEAMDIDADIFGGISNKEIFEWIKDNLDFHQLIAEFPDVNGNPQWVHVSLKRNGKNKKEVLRAKSIGGKTVYEKI